MQSKVGNKGPVRVTEVFPVSVSLLWKAITEVAQMRLWFFKNIPEFVPEVGFKTEFIVDAGERKFVHKWEIVEVDPLQKIVYKWQYAGYDAESYVTFLLKDIDGSTQLTLSHEGIENFPDEIPEFRRASCKEGWKYFIKDRLMQYISG